MNVHLIRLYLLTFFLCNVTSTVLAIASDSAAPVTRATLFALFSLAVGLCLAHDRPTRCSAECHPFAVSYQFQYSVGKGTVQPDSLFIKLLFTMWLLLSVRIFFRYSTSQPDLAHHRSLQSASTRSTRLSTLFKTCMDVAIYPQTRHAPTTYIPGLKNHHNMYVCCIQQSKSVRIINIKIEALHNPGHRRVCRPPNSGR